MKPARGADAGAFTGRQDAIRRGCAVGAVARRPGVQPAARARGRL